MTKLRLALAFVQIVILALFCVGSVAAADLPKSTQQILAELKLTGQPFLAGMDEEASSTPQAIIDAAKKERILKISSSVRPQDFRKMIAPLMERYPFLQISSVFASNFARTKKPLIAFQEGRVTDDIIEGVGGQISDYMQANALMRLDDLPNFKNVPAQMRNDKGLFVGLNLRYWCMAYNTSKLKETDLPATWDDLLTDQRLYKGRIGMGNNPNDFIIMLWGAKGPDWTKNFIEQLFTDVKPQLRKEGPSNLVGLVAAGELDVALPTAARRVQSYVKKGAPVGWHCPTPVPVSSSPLIIMNGAPHTNTAKLFVNWLLSKEGQIAQYYSDGSPPVHKDLQQEAFLQFPEQILNRPVAVRTPELLDKDMSIVSQIWQNYWLAGQ